MYQWSILKGPPQFQFESLSRWTRGLHCQQLLLFNICGVYLLLHMYMMCVGGGGYVCYGMHVDIRGQLLELVLPFYPGGPGIDEASDLLSRGFYQFSPLSS